MQTDYTFLTDHSYSLRPVDSDQGNFLKKTSTGKKAKTTRQLLPRSKKATSTNDRTISIDRNSSDKENNSAVPLTNKIKSIASRLSSRTNGKKSTKSTTKQTENSLRKKKNVNGRNSTKSNKIYSRKKFESNDVQTVLSIEERVKLRRTGSTPSSIFRKPKKLISKKNSAVQDDLDQIRQSLKNIPPFKSEEPTVKVNTNNSRTKKLFLGSGLDLDNILLGNRSRRTVQT